MTQVEESAAHLLLNILSQPPSPPVSLERVSIHALSNPDLPHPKKRRTDVIGTLVQPPSRTTPPLQRSDAEITPISGMESLPITIRSHVEELFVRIGSGGQRAAAARRAKNVSAKELVHNAVQMWDVVVTEGEADAVRRGGRARIRIGAGKARKLAAIFSDVVMRAEDGPIFGMALLHLAAAARAVNCRQNLGLAFRITAYAYSKYAHHPKLRLFACVQFQWYVAASSSHQHATTNADLWAHISDTCHRMGKYSHNPSDGYVNMWMANSGDHCVKFNNERAMHLTIEGTSRVFNTNLIHSNGVL